MYGLEKDQPGQFKFDLEKEITKDPNRAKQIYQKVQKHIQEIKSKLSSGVPEKEKKELSKLLEGYTAVERVLKRVSRG